jgi:hypothetical protein
MPSVSKAKAAAKTVFGIIEEPSIIDPKQGGEQSNSGTCISDTHHAKITYFEDSTY